MQINLPDESRLKRIADKLQFALKGMYGIGVTATGSKDIAARMLGFDSLQHFRKGNVPVPPSFWDEDQPEGIGELRRRQYVRCLLDEKLRGLGPEEAEEIVDVVGPTTKPRSGKAGELYIGSGFSERWVVFNETDIDRLGGGLGDEDAKRYSVAVRRLGNPTDFRDEAYAGYGEIHTDRGSEVSVILVATQSSGDPLVLGHVCYRTWINEDALIHKVEVISTFVDLTRIDRYAEADRIRSIIESGLRAVIVEDVRKRHYEFWKELAADNGELKIVIGPELSRWDDVMWPIQIKERIERELRVFSDPFRDQEHPVFPSYSISIDNDNQVCLPRVGRIVATFSELPRGTEFISLLASTEYWRTGLRAVLRLDPHKGTQDLLSWGVNGLSRYDPESEYKGRGELRDVILEGPRKLQASLAKGDAAELLSLCRDKVKILVASPKYACLIDEETIVGGVWDQVNGNADWIVNHSSTRSPGKEAYYDLLLKRLRTQLSSYTPMIASVASVARRK